MNEFLLDVDGNAVIGSNGFPVTPGTVIARQGDVFVRWNGYAGNPPAKSKVVGKERITVALGEFMGHEHNVCGLDQRGEVITQGPGFNWLQQATQADPNYLANFASGNVGVGEELLIQTSPDGVVLDDTRIPVSAMLFHEAGSRGSLDDDYHAPTPLPAGSDLSIYRQTEREIDQRQRNAAD